MDSFPAFIPLKGARVVVVGEGEAAEAKARLFAGSPAELLLLSADDALEPGALTGVRIAFIALSDNRLARRVAEAARAAGALVNVVDRPAMCDFTTPAIVDRGAVVAGVGTAGAAPVLAGLLRSDIEARWPEGLGRLGELSLKMQGEVREAFPDLPARRAFWRELIAGPAASAALEGDLGEAERLARDAIAARGPQAGRIWFMNAPDDPERLTLAALRALAAADRIVAGPDIEPAVLVYARRDAPRSESASPAELAAWATQGLSILRLAAQLDIAELESVQAAGARVELLPSAT